MPVSIMRICMSDPRSVLRSEMITACRYCFSVPRCQSSTMYHPSRHSGNDGPTGTFCITPQTMVLRVSPSERTGKWTAFSPECRRPVLISKGAQPLDQESHSQCSSPSSNPGFASRFPPPASAGCPSSPGRDVSWPSRSWVARNRSSEPTAMTPITTSGPLLWVFSFFFLAMASR